MRPLLRMTIAPVLFGAFAVGCGPKADPPGEVLPAVPAAPAPPLEAAAAGFQQTAEAWRAAGGMIDWVERDESAGLGGHDPLPACDRLRSSAYSPDDLTDPVLRITFTRAPADGFAKLPPLDVPFRIQLEWNYFHVMPPDEVPAKLFEELAAFEHLEGFTLVSGFVPVANFTPLGAAKNLRTVEFIGAPFSLSDVRALAKCEHLTTVRCGEEVFREDMKELAAVKSLRTLSLNRKLDYEIKAMSVLKNVRRLDLPNSSIGVSGADALGTLTELQSLDLRHGRDIDNNVMRELTSLTKLERLNLVRAGVRQEGFGHLRKFPGLRSLDLSDTNVSDEHMKVLVQLPKLRELRLNRVWMKGTGLAELAALPELECLEWSGADFSGAKSENVNVSGLERLRRLTIGSVSFTDTQLRLIGRLTELRELSLDGQNWTDEAFAELAGLKQLRALRVSCREKVSGSGLKHLVGLEHLHTLHVSGVNTPEGLTHIAKLSGLTELSLYGKGVTDAGFKELKALRKLRALDLSYAEVTEAGLKALAELPALEELNLNGVKVSKAGMKVLAGMKNLRRLDLSHDVDFFESIELHQALRACRITTH